MKLSLSNLFPTLFTIAMAFACITSVNSAELPEPSGRVLLRITGNIDNSNSSGAVDIDLQMLEQLEAHSFVTETPWTDGPVKFTGVRISDLLEYVGATTSEFRATAIDEYWNDLAEIDFDGIPAIVAYKRDDEYMRVRDLGPLWIMFPFDDFPELETEKFKTACVWQLIEINVH